MLEEAAARLEEPAARGSTTAERRRQHEGRTSKSRKVAAIPTSNAKRPRLQQKPRGRSHTRVQRGRSYSRYQEASPTETTRRPQTRRDQRYTRMIDE